ncbi:MAG: ABC transporter ATP-binding protein [Methanomassiliicoccus sp.]|nr:ABC transporter ATP-binding protein [Methanomassiliicoccus sp.]
MNEPSGSEIIISDLTKRYGEVTAVDHLTMSIARGEVFGLLGPNGAGKTTTMNILSTLDLPTQGAVSVGGYDVATEGQEIRELIGVCMQSSSVLPHLTGRENVELFAGLHALGRKEARERAGTLLNTVGLTADQGRRAGKYSEGMKKRLSLAMALASNPRIVFLDEPTAAMDPQARRAVWDIVTRMKEEERTVLLTTHYIEEAEQLCDRVGIIDHGRMIATGAPRDLIVQHGRDSLEEVFMDLTGREIREGGA